MTVASDSCLGGVDVGDDKAWPPGFRFHPTDEELVVYYLKRKICRRTLRLDIIREVDVYKWDPEELPGQSLLKTGDRQWFFFSPRDRKYPNGARSNRATRQGYWKATGKDRNVTCNSRIAGIKKTLVFYRGRAPNGERTDWVMHEYTLDEEELKRCPNVKDYYALYKVYKKSGPGPKNGEQYGAPFKEEDWADDDSGDISSSVTPVKKSNYVTPPVDNTKASAQVEIPLLQLNDLENFTKQIGDENLLDLSVTDYPGNLPQVTGDEETQSTLVDPSIREVTFVEPISVLPTSCQQLDMQASLDYNHSATSKLHLAPEVTSVPSNCDLVSQFCEDDFLEIDDLMDPEPTLSNAEKPAENLDFDDLNGLSDLDLYHDAAMFLREMEPVDLETISHINDVGFQLQPQSMGNQVDYQLQPHSVANQVNYQLQPQSAVNNVDYLQTQAFAADDFWLDDLTSNVFTATEPIQGTPVQSAPGVKSQSINNPTEANQNQGGEEGDATGWMSSTLWGFLESIPTTPASASENPLMNKAFERMSSFSRMKMNVKNNNLNANSLNICNGAATARTGGNGNRNRGWFIVLPILGALCAVLWVVLGAAREMGTAIS